MAMYRLVEVPGGSILRRWGIERFVPGERPETLAFLGRKGAAEAEIHRLQELDKAAPVPPKDPTP